MKAGYNYLIQKKAQRDGKPFTNPVFSKSFGNKILAVVITLCKPDSGGGIVLLEVDTNSPYAELKVQKLDVNGNVRSSLAIERVEGELDGNLDNTYRAHGFINARSGHRHKLDCYGACTEWDRLEAMPGLRG